MELYDRELADLHKSLAAKGVDPDDFRFERIFLPPESEDGAMFTVRYEVIVTPVKGGATLTTVGGIGLDWASVFERALADGYFDKG
jgi:hypothetical protein